MFTTTNNDDGNIPEYPGPTDTHIDTLRATQAGFCQALITRAEAVTSIVTPLLTPVHPSDIPTGDAFYPDPSTNPNRRNTTKTQQNPDTPAGERSLPAGFIRVSGVGVVRVADVAELRENLPMSVEAVLATVLDCTRMHVSSRVREILTLTLLMPNTWVHVKTGAIPFERASYAAYRAVKANVDIPAFDELLAASRLNVSITTFRKMVSDIIATLTTPVEVNRNAHENRRVRLLRGVAGESTIAITGPTITVEAMYKRFTATARSIQKNLLTHFTGHPVTMCGPACVHPTTCDCTHCHTPDCATHTSNPCTCTTSEHANTAASGRVTDAFGLPVEHPTVTDDPNPHTGEHSTHEHCTHGHGSAPDVPVGELGVVEEILDARLFDQLVFDVVDGAKPSTTVTARVIPTNTSKPATVREEPPTRRAGFMDRWEDRNETTEAQQVQEMRLCVSMPTSTEWLKSQACLNIMIPFMHLLPNNGNTNHITSCPIRNGTEVTATMPRGHTTTVGTTNTRIEVPPDTGTAAPPPDMNSPNDPGGLDPTLQKTDSSEHQGTSGPVDQAGRPSGGVPVMVNNRFSLDPYTTDQLLKGASWVYRYFTDPTTGTVTEALPMRYQVPKALKLMLEARWETCSVPWCSTPARVCEKDHIRPFNHRDPANGGLTVAENLHPLCKRHHQAKTEGRISVARTPDGGVEWEFPSIGTVLSYPPESLIQQRHYQQLQNYATAHADSNTEALERACPSVEESEAECVDMGGPEHTITYNPSEIASAANSATRSPVPELELTPDPNDDPPPF